MDNNKTYWEIRELVAIGVFASVAKVSSILVTLLGGGMNPLSLILKNLLFTTLVIVLLYKVKKFGTLTLFLLINVIVSMLLMGADLFLIPPMIVAGLLAESLIKLLGGYKKDLNIIIGVGVYDILYKSISIGVSWLYMREQPQMMIMITAVVAIGYIGAFLGLFSGAMFVKELRHACIIRS